MSVDQNMKEGPLRLTSLLRARGNLSVCYQRPSPDEYKALLHKKLLQKAEKQAADEVLQWEKLSETVRAEVSGSGAKNADLLLREFLRKVKAIGQ